MSEISPKTVKVMVNRLPRVHRVYGGAGIEVGFAEIPESGTAVVYWEADDGGKGYELPTKAAVEKFNDKVSVYNKEGLDVVDRHPEAEEYGFEVL